MKNLILVIGLIGILILGGCAGKLNNEYSSKYSHAQSLSQAPTVAPDRIVQAYAEAIKVWPNNVSQEDYSNAIDQFVTRLAPDYERRGKMDLGSLYASEQQKEKIREERQKKLNQGLDGKQLSMLYLSTDLEAKALQKILRDSVLWYDPAVLNTKSLVLLGAMLLPRLALEAEWPVYFRIYMTLANRPDSLAYLQEIPSFPVWSWDKIAPILQAFTSHPEYHSQEVIKQAEVLLRMIELAPAAVAKGKTNIGMFFRPDLEKLPEDEQVALRPVFDLYHNRPCNQFLMCQRWGRNLNQIAQTGKDVKGGPHLESK